MQVLLYSSHKSNIKKDSKYEQYIQILQINLLPLFKFFSPGKMNSFPEKLQNQVLEEIFSIMSQFASTVRQR